MNGCNGAGSCPVPTNATVPSDCKLLAQYGVLCRDMPEMGQCKAWKTFCATSGTGSTFCTGIAAIGRNGSPTSDKSKNSAAKGPAEILFFGVTALLCLL